jgi:hypothetical protein
MAVTNHRTGFQREIWENYQELCMAFPPSLLCSKRPMDTNKPQSMAKAPETCCCNLKSKVSLNLKGLSSEN